LDVQDIAPDGSVLLSTQGPRVVLEAVGASDSAPRVLSWYDWSVVKDISQDGQWILFEESSEPFGDRYAVAARKVDGSLPIHLGEGSAGGLSPDGKWALDVATGDPPDVKLLPIGTGQAREVPLAGLEHVQNGAARFMPDGREIIINGNEAGHSVRGYRVDLVGGKLRPVTPEGMAALLVSPNGRYVTAQSADSSVVLCSVENATAQKIPGMNADDTAAQWSDDSTALYVYRSGEVPAHIVRLNLRSGQRTPVREITPSERAGVVSISPITMSRDASRFAYSYYQNLSILYVVAGLH
jgi:hypothetical protein